MATHRRSAKPKASEASLELWHRRMGHMHAETIKKAAELVNGVKINNTTTSVSEASPCSVCSQSDATRQISRRPIGRTFGKYGQVHYDLVYFGQAINGHRWMTHFFVLGMRFHWIWTHTTKDEARIAIKHFINFAIRFWNLPIVAFHSDNEKSVTMEFEEDHMRAQGFILTHSPEYHPEMNGPAERSGGVIITLARRLRVESGLPMSLWSEFVGAAVWILNRMPTHLKDEKRWIVPWEEIRAHFGEENLKKTDLSDLSAYGSLTYIRVPNILRMVMEQIATLKKRGYYERCECCE